MSMLHIHLHGHVPEFFILVSNTVLIAAVQTPFQGYSPTCILVVAGHYSWGQRKG